MRCMPCRRGSVGSGERHRALWHPSGDSDAEGFVAMGTVEVLLHTHDVLAGLGVGWRPDDALCDRVLARL